MSLSPRRGVVAQGREPDRLREPWQASEVGDDSTESWMWIRSGEDERERVCEGRIHDRDAAQVVVRRPDVPVACPNEGGHVRGVREGVQEYFVSEVRACRVDA